jgi:hypothetical protein
MSSQKIRVLVLGAGYAGMMAALVAGSVLSLVTSLAQIFAPEWFYNNIGYFPPFNRHYVGDLGAFSLPWGIGLLWAARHPQQHRLLIGCAVLANGLHVLNRLYDDLNSGVQLSGGVWQTLVLATFTLVLAAAWWASSRSAVTA